MNSELKNIKLSYTDIDFYTKLSKIRQKVIGASELTQGQLADLAEIIANVKQNLDLAVIEYTKKFDNVTLSCDDFLVSEEEIEKAHKQIDKGLLTSIKKSIANVRKYQQEIFNANSKTCSNGTGIKYTPLKRIGICVPGASAPLPSTVIMTAIPAQVAGVKEIAVISPPRYKGTIHPTILAVCAELQIYEVYRIGGAQAVAALAFGTPTVANVDKIVGPGNQWVQNAKKMVMGQVGIDSIAGPSEVLIIADDSANPKWVAADLLSQAEHAPGSAILFTNSKNIADAVAKELKSQLPLLDRADDARECIENFGAIVTFESIEDCIAWADEFATEHLQIQCGQNSRRIAEKVKNAGAIFIGDYTPVATGDYFAGPSHTLPTGTSAKFFSALSSNDFVKATSIIEYTKDMLTDNATDITRLAETEGLNAHANSVNLRTQK